MRGGLAGRSRDTVEGDKAYDSKKVVGKSQSINAAFQVVQNTRDRARAVDERATRHAGYGSGQGERKGVDEISGWLKTVGFLQKTGHRGAIRAGWILTFGVAVDNLVTIRNMIEAPA
jgi:hypothetical protein